MIYTVGKLVFYCPPGEHVLEAARITKLNFPPKDNFIEIQRETGEVAKVYKRDLGKADPLINSCCEWCGFFRAINQEKRNDGERLGVCLYPKSSTFGILKAVSAKSCDHWKWRPDFNEETDLDQLEMCDAVSDILKGMETIRHHAQNIIRAVPHFFEVRRDVEYRYDKRCSICLTHYAEPIIAAKVVTWRDLKRDRRLFVANRIVCIECITAIANAGFELDKQKYEELDECEDTIPASTIPGQDE